MRTVGVCGEGLSAAADDCADTASRLAGKVAAATTGPSGQATAEAVSNAYIVLQATAAQLAARVRAASENLTTAANQYLRTDEAVAGYISELGGRRKR